METSEFIKHRLQDPNKGIVGKLQNVISKLVNEDQVGYITGRYIGETIRTIDDIMILTEKEQMPGFITLLDFEKAFDSIEWPFYLIVKKFQFW